jgi:hypothetical protein
MPLTTVKFALKNPESVGENGFLAVRTDDGRAVKLGMDDAPSVEGVHFQIRGKVNGRTHRWIMGQLPKRTCGLNDSPNLSHEPSDQNPASDDREDVADSTLRRVRIGGGDMVAEQRVVVRVRRERHSVNIGCNVTGVEPLIVPSFA